MSLNLKPVGAAAEPRVVFATITASFAEREAYAVGVNGVTEITIVRRQVGETGCAAFVCIWAGEKPIAEFAQHNIVGVYFEGDEQAAAMREEMASALEESRA